MTRSILILMAALTTGGLNAQTISYQWLNQPCGDMLNCIGGCSACNLPEHAPGVFIGTNVAWFGVTTCPYAVALGDNAVFSSGWTVLPSETRSILLSGIATTELQVDSLIIRYASWDNGPQRAKILFDSNASAPMVEIGDVSSPQQEFATAVFTDLGCLEIPEGSSTGTFQLKMVPYESATGSWVLDEVRIVASPCQAATVGIEEFSRTTTVTGPYVDIMGRPVKDEPAPGVYIRGRKQVQVF
jgi:hypothetical protein